MKAATNALKGAWQWLRAVSGDDAYERYVAYQRRTGRGEVPSRQDFYRQRLERKYNNKDSPARCC